MANSNTDPTDFASFLERVRSAAFGEIRAADGRHVAEEEELEKMRQHILDTYEGVDVVNSYLDDAGLVWDCIPIEQQPSLRGTSGGPATPVDAPVSDREVEEPSRKGQPLEQQVRLGEKDRLGNVIGCPEGTIPMRRVTLSDMARFRTLRDFFRKAPDGGQHPRDLGATATASHKYAHAYQNAGNLGGHSFLNVWQPSINTAASQVFSLSQHWYAGGSGGSLQTVECGWQVYPQMYGNANCNLFIYWTADDYQSTGCYNLTCSAFVQTNPNFHLGGAWKPVSSTGGTQYEAEYAFYLYQGNWWLYLLGTKAADTVGYYPTSLFGGGQLSKHAQNIDYGGETVGSTSWPPMGSGAFASGGWQKAAYQRDIYYYPDSGGAKEASLSESEPSKSCYTIDVSGKGSWNEHFYFGGPGGSSC